MEKLLRSREVLQLQTPSCFLIEGLVRIQSSVTRGVLELGCCDDLSHGTRSQCQYKIKSRHAAAAVQHNESLVGDQWYQGLSSSGMPTF
jgi:hypothetical protein